MQRPRREAEGWQRWRKRRCITRHVPPSKRPFTLEPRFGSEPVSRPGPIQGSEALLTSYCLASRSSRCGACCWTFNRIRNSPSRSSRIHILASRRRLPQRQVHSGFQLHWKISTKKMVRSLPPFFPWKRSIANEFSSNIFTIMLPLWGMVWTWTNEFG